MTNLEWLARNADDYLTEGYFCEFAYIAKYGRPCKISECKTCEMRDADEPIKALKEECEDGEQ